MKKQKKLLLLVISVIMVLTMTACGTEKVKEKLAVGAWGYLVESIDGPCYQIYQFKSDDTYEAVWLNENASWKNGESSGTYKIKKSEIILTENTGETYSIIKYTFEDDELSLVDIHSDGSGNRPLIWVEV